MTTNRVDDMRKVVGWLRANPAPHRTIDQVDDMRTVVTEITDTSDPFQAGDRVESEYGQGTVIAYSSRRLAYRLDSGETINVVTGTPGFCRVTRVES